MITEEQKEIILATLLGNSDYFTNINRQYDIRQNILKELELRQMKLQSRTLYDHIYRNEEFLKDLLQGANPQQNINNVNPIINGQRASSKYTRMTTRQKEIAINILLKYSDYFNCIQKFNHNDVLKYRMNIRREILDTFEKENIKLENERALIDCINNNKTDLINLLENDLASDIKQNLIDRIVKKNTFILNGILKSTLTPEKKQIIEDTLAEKQYFTQIHERKKQICNELIQSTNLTYRQLNNYIIQYNLKKQKGQNEINVLAEQNYDYNQMIEDLQNFLLNGNIDFTKK